MSNELYHYGIPGMKWGVRRTRVKLSHHEKVTKRKAEKDAKEYARAKMYYGEGAGNRRKLIKATVAERSKDPKYKAYFDAALADQDMAKHAARARSERHTRDAAKTTSKVARGVVNVAAGGGYPYSNGAAAYRAIRRGAQVRAGARALGRMGMNVIW